MAVKTVQLANSTWSNTSNWNGGTLPVSGDSVVCNSPNILTMDVDTSGMAAGIAGVSGTGTLQVSTSAGTYILKITAAISIANFLIGTSLAVPLPANVTFMITTTTNINAITSANFQCFAQNSPTHTFCKLSQAAIIGDTVLNVDTDLTGAGDSSFWKLNAWGQPTLLNIDNVAQAANSEQRTLSAISSTQITISAGLTAAKAAGTYLLLLSRNVKITGGATGAGLSGITAPVMNAEIRGFASGLSVCASPTVGGTVSGSTSGLNTCPSAIVSGIVSGCTAGLNGCIAPQMSGIVSGCTNGLTTCLSAIVSGTVSGCTNGLTSCATASASGTVSGCGSGFNSCTAVNLSGGVSNCVNGLNNCSVLLRQATLQTNTNDLNSVVIGQAFNTLLGSTVEYLGYNSVSNQSYNSMESFDHDQVSGAYRNWCRGGITSSNTGTVYGTRTRSYQHALELGVAGSYSFRDQTVEVPAGGWVNVNCFIQKDSSMAYLPNLQIFPASVEPLISGSASATATMTNSISTWEVLFAKYQNTTTAPQLVKVRVIGQNASGNIFEDCDISVSPFGFALGSAA